MTSELKFNVNSCCECPCLRNNEYGEFTCFFNSNIQMPCFDLDVISGLCPLLCEEEEDE